MQIAFYNDVSGLVVEGTVVDIVYLNFSKVFVIASQIALIHKLMK